MSDEPTLDRLRDEVYQAKAALLALAPERPEWCARELRDRVVRRVGVSSEAAQIALCDLNNPEHDGRLELTETLRVRVPR